MVRNIHDSIAFLICTIYILLYICSTENSSTLIVPPVMCILYFILYVCTLTVFKLFIGIIIIIKIMFFITWHKNEQTEIKKYHVS